MIVSIYSAGIVCIWRCYVFTTQNDTCSMGLSLRPTLRWQAITKPLTGIKFGMQH